MRHVRVIGVLVGALLLSNSLAVTATATGQPASIAPGQARPHRLAGALPPDLGRRITTVAPPAHLAVVVRLVGSLDLSTVAVANDTTPTEGEQDRSSNDVVTALTATAASNRARVLDLLDELQLQGEVSRIEPLWVINGIAVTATPAVIAALAAHPDVVSVEPDETILATPAPAEAAGDPWNLAAVNAPGYWSLGHEGGGVVIGTIDTGANLAGGTWDPATGSSELADTWRGGTNSWFDAVDGTGAPIDPPGFGGLMHGTAVLGVAVGDDRRGAALGVAPGARWIAARAFDTSFSASTSDVHAAFQWLLDPDGDPTTADAPDIVNGSWAFAPAVCDSEFRADVQALRAAGILAVFAAGNQGAATSPANYPESFSVGAVDEAAAIWDDPVGASGLGPTDCETPGASRTYPDLTAPGVDVEVIDGTWLFATATGTSLAAPHVSGAAALLLSEFPTLTVTELEAVLREGAQDLGASGPDDTFGAGRLDVLGARNAVARASVGDLVWLDANGDGVFDDGEPAIPDARVELRVPGPDGQLGVGEDPVVAERLTGFLGDYVFTDLRAGTYRVQLDLASIPLGTLPSTPTHYDVVLAVAQDLRTADFGLTPPPPADIPERVYLSSDRAGLLGPGAPDPSTPYRDEDVILWDGTELSLFFDGSDVRLGLADLDALEVIDDKTILFSLDAPGRVTGIGMVDDSDIVRFEGQTGPSTQGQMSLWLDGSDVGLSSDHEDVDAIALTATGTILISTTGRAQVPGLPPVTDEDIIELVPTSLGRRASGTWRFYFDGSAVGLDRASEDLDGLALLAEDLVLSTLGAFDVGPVTGTGRDLLTCASPAIPPPTSCTWAAYLDPDDLGLTPIGSVDGVSVRPA